MNREAQAPGAGHALPRPAGRTWRPLVLGLVIFLSGGLFGGGLTVLAVRSIATRTLRHPEGIPLQLAGRMRQRLRLSDVQERQVRDIIARRQESLCAMRDEFRPRLERELEEVRQEIGSVLDRRQARAWDEWFDKRCRSWLGKPPRGLRPPLPRRRE